MNGQEYINKNSKEISPKISLTLFLFFSIVKNKNKYKIKNKEVFFFCDRQIGEYLI